MNTYSHFSDEPLLEPYSVQQIGARDYKPSGLWISVDGEDNWEQFCAEESFRDLNAQYRYQVELAPGANILRLSSAQALREFTAQHHPPKQHPYLGEGDFVDWPIDWTEVASLYQGILITPYQWECRSDPGTFWYYTWDCASGCIWDASAISSVKLARAPLKSRPEAA